MPIVGAAEPSDMGAAAKAAKEEVILLPEASSSAAEPATGEGRVLRWPRDPKAAGIIGIFLIMLVTAAYLAREIVVPVVFAFVLSLLLQPAMRGLTRLHIPKPIAALLILSTFFGCLGGFLFAVSGPAAGWISKAPEALPRLEQRLSVLKKPIAMLQALLDKVQQLTQASSGEIPVQMKGAGVSELLFGSTHVIASFGVTLILLFYLLVAGDLFLRRLVEILPSYRNKKQAVTISREIERNISQYLMTISLMNIAVGVATAFAAYVCGLADPLLWGTGAFLLNYIMILGPMAGIGILLAAGFLSFDSPLHALLPAGLYLCIHIAEGEFVTPMLLARRFTLNQVLVIISLIFWFWMWGIAGALLAVPLLAVLKIICDHIESLAAIGHFIGGENGERTGELRR